jgi:hypothetical protein
VVSRYNALCASLAVVLASLVWAPDILPAAAVLGGLGALGALALPAPRRQPPARIVTRLPTDYEREHARWLPGAGLGFSLFHWPPRPFAFLTFWRWRRK